MDASSKITLIRPRLLRLPRICVPIVGADAGEMISKAGELSAENLFLEFRLDYLAQPLLGLSKLKKFLELHTHLRAIATCRRAPNGGKFKGTVAAQVEVLEKAVWAGCQLVDLELQSASRLEAAHLDRLRGKAALILSFHDFEATKDLDAKFQKLVRIPAEYYKLVTTANSLHDNVSMMKFIEQQSHDHGMIGLCMGEQGVISRVLGVRAGSVFTFAAVSGEERTAPGQVVAQELRQTYRIDQVDAATKVYGVAGNPVANSLSPAVMNAALRRENVNAVYLPLHTRTLKDLLACVRDIPIQGLSVTMPYKESIIEHLDNTDAQTSAIGACNTVVRAQDGKLYGFNTDMAGVIRPLEQRTTLPGTKVLVLGAGGAARAAVFGLKSRGAEVFVLNRTAERGQKLARQAKVRTIKRGDLAKQQFDIIINATPVGMGGAAQSPLKAEEIRARYVFDFVYDSSETPLMKLAATAGAQVISGIEMFAWQAASQFEIWTGKPAPAAEMLQVAVAARQEREEASAQVNP